ncbi:MAG: septum formation initiator family protein [Candidatus Fimenecus sp.]
MKETVRKMKAKKRKPQKHSFILTLALLLAAGYFVISFISAQLEIREKEKEAAQIQAQIVAQQAENERLQAVVDGGDEKEYIERVAREKLGYVMPDEKVYYDITPSN